MLIVVCMKYSNCKQNHKYNTAYHTDTNYNLFSKQSDDNYLPGLINEQTTSF